jgi:hypothetical protein
MPKITYHQNKEGDNIKVTSVEKDEKFIFLGDDYSRAVLRSAKLIKNYMMDSHESISLLEDQYGRFFYHSWLEEMNFGSGDDYIDESFNLVDNEKEADDLFDAKNTIYGGHGRIPYVYMSEKDCICAYEKVDSLPEIS